VPANDPKAPPVRLWIGRRDTARKLRDHLEAVLGWAGARELRTTDNPARWDVLKHLLPAPANLKKVKPVEHHTALPYAHAKAFMDALKIRGGTAARALELTILTAVRTGEALKTTWGEIDLTAKTWTLSTARTKTAEELCVPLSDAAVTLLKSLKPKDVKAGDPVVSGREAGAAAVGYGDGDDASAHGPRRPHGPWVPIDVQGLGRRENHAPAGAARKSARPRRRR
jgi:integrase